jgi:hypothetical protein
MSGPHPGDHLLVDDHGDQIFAITDDVTKRVRKLGGTTIRSVVHVARLQRIADNDAKFVTAQDMLSELHEDEKAFVLSMRTVHSLCERQVTWRQPVFLKTGLISLSVVAGFFSKQLATRSPRSKLTESFSYTAARRAKSDLGREFDPSSYKVNVRHRAKSPT